MSEIFSAFADIIDYPGPEIFDQVCRLLKLLEARGRGQADRRACELLEAFGVACRELGIARLQEAYTAAFDMRAEGSLYVGHYLFGDSWQRSHFLAQLLKSYRRLDFSPGADLPDHVAVILRFLSLEAAIEEREDLIADCLVPATRAILGKSVDPYRQALHALLFCLEQELRKEPV